MQTCSPSGAARRRISVGRRSVTDHMQRPVRLTGDRVDQHVDALVGIESADVPDAERAGCRVRWRAGMKPLDVDAERQHLDGPR